MTVIKALAFGSLIWMIGFGCGRLTFHASFRRNKTLRKRITAQSIRSLQDNPLVDIWLSMYNQTIDTTRDLIKGLFTASTVGLAVSATLLTRQSSQPVLIYFSIILCLTSMATAIQAQSIVSRSQSRITEKMAIKASAHEVRQRRFILPLPMKKHKHQVGIAIAIFTFAAAAIILSLTASGMIVCATNPTGAGQPWYFQCVQETAHKSP